MAAKYQTIHHVKAWIFVFLALNTMRGHCKTYVYCIFFFSFFPDILYKYLKMRDRNSFPCPDPLITYVSMYNRYSNNYLYLERAKRKGKEKKQRKEDGAPKGKKDTFKKGFFRKGYLILNTPRHHRTSSQSQHPKINKQDLFLTIIVCNFVHF